MYNPNYTLTDSNAITYVYIHGDMQNIPLQNFRFCFDSDRLDRCKIIAGAIEKLEYEADNWFIDEVLKILCRKNHISRGYV